MLLSQAFALPCFSLSLSLSFAMIRVAVGIIVQNGDVLLCQRKQASRYGLKWEFPGGKVKNGEATEKCLQRELLEELGITVEVGPLFHRQHYVYPDSGAFEVLYYLIQTYTGEMKNHVFESYRWTPIVELPSFDILEGNRNVVEKLLMTHAESKSKTA